jgi:hypothetical protein
MFEAKNCSLRDCYTLVNSLLLNLLFAFSTKVRTVKTRRVGTASTIQTEMGVLKNLCSTKDKILIIQWSRVFFENLTVV